jgi:hypothetical protein
MNEYLLQLFAVLRIFWVLLYAYLYGLGGISNKWVRRYVGSAWLVLGYIGFSLQTGVFSPYLLICLPLLIGATSIGYGADDVGIKIFKRFYCGALYAVAALPVAFVTGNWVMFALHTVLCVGFSVVLGVVNPVYARKEETLIGLAIGLLPTFMV